MVRIHKKAHICIFLLLCSLLAGCLSPALPKGTVATVATEPISFVSLETRRLALFPQATGSALTISQETLQQQYAYTLRQLIFEKLIVQFMKSKGYTGKKEALAEREALLRADYPGVLFDEMLLHEGIVLEEWRKALQTQLTVEDFVASHIRPAVSISSQETESFYIRYKQHFVVPGKWHYLHVRGDSKETVKQALSALVAGEKALDVQREKTVTILDVLLGVDRLPKEVIEALQPLQPLQATPIAQADGKWQAFVLFEKHPERPLNPAEIAQIIENLLGEEKLQHVYVEWLKKQVKKNRIALHPSIPSELVWQKYVE